MPEGLEVKLPLGANNLLTNIPGGHPISLDGKVVGGFGIAGGTPSNKMLRLRRQ